MFVDNEREELNFKFVYYGPVLAGKTSSLQYIYDKITPEARSELFRVSTGEDQLLCFNLLPTDISEPPNGFKTRFHLYTLPGLVFHDISLHLILQGVDGVIFVADSQRERAEANLESLEQLERYLALEGYDPAALPRVYAYNKRDLPGVLSVEELKKSLNPQDKYPSFETVATRGVGVFDSLKEVAKAALAKERRLLA